MRRLGLLAARLAGGAAVFLGVMMLFAGWYTGEPNPWGSCVGAAGTVGGVLLLLSLNEQTLSRIPNAPARNGTYGQRGQAYILQVMGELSASPPGGSKRRVLARE